MNPEKKKPKKGMWMDMNDAAKKMAIEKDPKNEDKQVAVKVTGVEGADCEPRKRRAPKTEEEKEEEEKARAERAEAKKSSDAKKPKGSSKGGKGKGRGKSGGKGKKA